MIIMHRRAARGNGAAADICARLIEERLVAAVAALTPEQRGTLRTPDDPRVQGRPRSSQTTSLRAGR